MHAWHGKKTIMGYRSLKKEEKEERKCNIFSSKLQRWNCCFAQPTVRGLEWHDGSAATAKLHPGPLPPSLCPLRASHLPSRH